MHIEFVDKTLDPKEYDAEEVKKIIEIGLLCTQASPSARPRMSEIVRMLKRKSLMEHQQPTMPVYVDPISFSKREADSSMTDMSSSSNATASISVLSGRWLLITRMVLKWKMYASYIIEKEIILAIFASGVR